MILTQSVRCPYCGERFETVVDISAGNQTYVEDCYVCCRPILFQLMVSPDGALEEIVVRRDDD